MNVSTHCHYCGCPLEPRKSDSPRRRTWDHKIPKCRGGGEDTNKVACCYACNNEKGELTDVEYLAWKTAGRPDRTRVMSAISAAPKNPGPKIIKIKGPLPAWLDGKTEGPVWRIEIG